MFSWSDPLSSEIRTPKLRQSRGRPTPSRKYYAGYDPGFVEDMLQEFKLDAGSVLLDPWNGAGTTTEVAARLGQASIGFDINPVMVVVAKSKLLSVHDSQSLGPMAKDILAKAKTMRRRKNPDSEPLLAWFEHDTALHLRKIADSIDNKLVPEADGTTFDAARLDQVSALAATFYVTLFETVRGFLHSFVGANPTWFKGGGGAVRIQVDVDNIEAAFHRAERRLHGSLALPLDVPDDTLGTYADLRLGASDDLPLEENSIDACITSPPYCTRIEYPVLTRPELAVLGIGDGAEFRQLREASIGTTTMTADQPLSRDAWGESINSFLKKVEEHPSKASSTYYLRYFEQYFDGMSRSLQQLKLVLKPGAKCAVVVQDSYYKEVHNDLAGGLIEMAGVAGLTSLAKRDFKVQRTLAQVHPGARQYRDTFKATESLILFEA